MLRVFRDGRTVEEAVLSDLRAAGFEISSHGPDGKQHSAVMKLEGSPRKIVGKMDGIIASSPIPHLKCPAVLEIKSFNRDTFEKLQKGGIRKVKPQYYNQCMLYMGYCGYEEGLIVCYCKDDGRYHAEIVRLDTDLVNELYERAVRLLTFGTADDLPREGTSQSAPPCRWCRHAQTCWADETAIQRLAEKVPSWAI